MRGKRKICLVMFFRQYLDGSEMRSETGAMQLVGLLVLISLGDKNKAVARGEFVERGSNAGKKLDLLLGDGLGEAFNATVLFVCHGNVAELFEAGDQRPAEAVKPVTVCAYSVVLDSVEVAADFFRSVNSVIKIGDEAGDGTLEVDVVFPKSVVSIDQQGLVSRMADDWGRRVHTSIIKCSRTRWMCGGEVLNGMPRLGDVFLELAVRELEAVSSPGLVRLDRSTKFCALSAEFVYRVWTPL